MKKRGRKRTADSILDEHNTPSSSTSRQIPTSRAKVKCFCSKCGKLGKMVDPRTKDAHERKDQSTSLSADETPLSQVLTEMLDSTMSLASSQDTTMLTDTNSPHASDNVMYESQNFTFLPRKKRAKVGTIHVTKVEDEQFELDSEDSDIIESTEHDTDDNRTSEQEEDDSEFSTNFENYSHPIFDFDTPVDISGLPKDKLINGILIWIMKFRSSHNVSNTAIEELIQFVKILLKVCKNIDHESFLNSLYMLRKTLCLIDRFSQFAACQKCHKLYKKEEVMSEDNNTIMKCSHVEFPNSTTKRTKKCKTPLGKKITLNNSTSIVPELVYPVSSIQQQLSSMFKRPGFEELLRHWTHRSVIDNVLSDIYDGQVWQNLKESSEQGSNNFFRSDKADTHLGLMMNLDWFQPYEGTTYSTGVIYAVICNLPRDVRFKPENMLILSILPGPKEVSLHRINHYLSPIITELESLWEGVTLNHTYECSNGKDIRAALIIASCDIPAARKLCGHISALASCHRCEKKANNRNFGGMSNMDDWFIMKDSTKHRQKALEW